MEEMSAANKHIQQLQTELNKKDLDLQSLDTKTTWDHDQQQEMCDKLRQALNEKDKTIEVIILTIVLSCILFYSFLF